MKCGSGVCSIFFLLRVFSYHLRWLTDTCFAGNISCSIALNAIYSYSSCILPLIGGWWHHILMKYVFNIWINLLFHLNIRWHATKYQSIHIRLWSSVRNRTETAARKTYSKSVSKPKKFVGFWAKFSHFVFGIFRSLDSLFNV